MRNGSTRPPPDRFLLLEVVLILLLAGLALALYLVPAVGGDFVPEWWVAVLLGGLFFAVVALHRWRHTRGGRLRVLRAELRERRSTGARE